MVNRYDASPSSDSKSTPITSFTPSTRPSSNSSDTKASDLSKDAKIADSVGKTHLSDMSNSTPSTIQAATSSVQPNESNSVSKSLGC